MKRFLTLFAGLLLLLALLLLAPPVSRADDDDDDEHEEHSRLRGGAVALRKAAAWKPYLAECGSCHTAYPPNMLPAESWSALLGGLNDHFGQNAELDAATSKQLEDFLRANAARSDGASKPPLRITTLPWWRREHDEVPAGVYARKAVMTRSNCGACHPGANEGDFGEHKVKIPKDAPAAR